MKKIFIALVVVIVAIAGLFVMAKHSSAPVIHQPPSIQSLSVSQHTALSMVAQDLGDVKAIAFDSAHHMVVSVGTLGQIIGLVDTDNDSTFDKHQVILTKLNQPYGLAFVVDPTNHKEYLYVAETDKLNRYAYNASMMTVGNAEPIALLVGGGLNPFRSLMIGPKLRAKDLVTNSPVGTMGNTFVYVGAGSSCQACQESSFKRGAILETDLAGSYIAQFARGLRSTLAMAINPRDGKMWATDIGRTDLGTSLPPDEINSVDFTGDYGWPLCYGNQLPDSVYSPTPAPNDRAGLKHVTTCDSTIAPRILLPAHASPTGLAFIPMTGTVWPADWRGNLIVAYHGDQRNSSGYKLVRFVLDDKGVIQKTEDITSWFNNGSILGTPRDIVVGPDGALYTTDDYSGVIYKLVYKP